MDGLAEQWRRILRGQRGRPMKTLELGAPPSITKRTVASCNAEKLTEQAGQTHSVRLGNFWPNYEPSDGPSATASSMKCPTLEPLQNLMPAADEIPTTCFHIFGAMQSLLKFGTGLQEMGAITGVCYVRHITRAHRRRLLMPSDPQASMDHRDSGDAAHYGFSVGNILLIAGLLLFAFGELRYYHTARNNLRSTPITR